MESEGPLPSSLSLVVAIGGLDPTGGAGVVRDSRTAAALGAGAHIVGTAWTEQGDAVHNVEARDPARLAAAVHHAVARRPGAVKIGMVPNGLAIAAILDGLAQYAGPVVFDPVLASSRGGVLFEGTVTDIVPLLRRASLVTPNAPEAATLSGRAVAGVDDALAAARALQALGAAGVLVKGGHLGGPTEPVVDLLLDAAGPRRFTHPRLAGRIPRGTGCALATAIAVRLAQGDALDEAVAAAIAWLAGAIQSAVIVAGERHLGG
jgi:hydroxymethylpyrimidine/phosphomethylpyrimidine kinase